METNNELSLIMGQRLKALRNEKGISHETLRKALTEKYEIDISVDSLKNYEVSSADHSKSYKNNGMKVEYLRCLADFYGVSADYLLGLSNVKSPDTNVSKIMQYTGLTEDNVLFLHNSSDIYGDDEPLNYFRKSCYCLINDLIEMCRSDSIHIPFWRIQNLLSSFDGETARTDQDLVADAIARKRGYAVLTVNESIAFHAGQMSQKIEESITDKYFIEQTSEPYGRHSTIEINGKKVDVWSE